MNAITVMLDEEYESVSLALGDKNEYTLGRIGRHNIAIVGPARGAQGKVAIADVVGSMHWTFRNMTIGLLVGIGEACLTFLSKTYDWEMSSLEPRKWARQWSSMTWGRKRPRDLK